MNAKIRFGVITAIGIALVSLLSSNNALHAQQALTEVSVESKTITPGSTSSVNIVISEGPDAGVADIQGLLKFDPKVLKATRIEGQQDYEIFASKLDNNAGEVKFLVTKLRAPYAKAGPIIKIEFQAIGKSGDKSDLRLTLDVLRDPDGRNIPNKIINGLITLGSVQNQPPTAKFSFTPAEPKVDEEISFKDESTDPDGASDIVSWEWDFGDGTTSTEQNPKKKYAQKKVYDVRLTVRDRGGLTNFVIKKVPVGIVPPKADFTFTPTSPEVGDEVQFTDKSTDDGQIVSRQWDFGDGTTSTDQNPKKRYAQAGTFKVKLTVRDNDGAESSVEKTITVKASSKPTISVFPNPARDSATFVFTLPPGATTGTLFVFNMAGKLVLKQEKLTGTQFVWDIKKADVPSGPYYYLLLAFKDNAVVGRSRVEKLVIQR
uniref:PKD domain protein n=2 Tax=Candidatus Bipolaricaulota TaxID=67810 RepID=H5S939_9BACT|nr:PKD domain protein [uncultured Acetothermia bacterium]BAL59270.1 PKD domain protein [Candidatus Acetothermum autotrophicum]